MNNNPSVTTTSTTNSSTLLRPRPKRLISGLSDNDESGQDSLPASPQRLISPLPSPFGSRSASPIPAAHPQRGNGSTAGGSKNTAGSSWGRRAQLANSQAVQANRKLKGNDSSPASPTSLAGLWGTSWTTLQGIASDFLGNDVSGGGGVDASSRQRKPFGTLYSPRSASSPREWGPPPTSQPTTAKDIGSGTREEREAAVRAEKRKDLLMRQDSNYADSMGKFKRRLSDDREAISAPPGENDHRSAMVYLHHVEKNDTLAGISIKYNCAANILRKANRMWPNDTAQSRQTLVLPVDACGVKGRPIPGPEAVDLLSSESDALLAGQAEEVTTPKPPLTNGESSGNGVHNRENSMSTDTSRRASSSIAAAADNSSEPPWHHDSWVVLPGFSKPTEIARLSRRTLGYFPPARRKSLSYSDYNTPSTSLDLSRGLATAATLPAPDTSPNSGVGRMSESSPQRPRRQRKLSNASTGYFPSYLSGPGGVGTMKSNVHFPGPAQDGLNKMFAKHLPDVAPPKNQIDLYQPELPLYTDDPSLSGTITPSNITSAQNQSLNNNSGLNLENVGGAIESWVRRLATKATTPSERAQKQKAARASVGTPGRGGGGIGDLIEMTDEFEIGGDEDDEEEEMERRGRQSSAGVAAARMDRIGGTATDYSGGSVAKGRAVASRSAGASSSGKKAGKDD